MTAETAVDVSGEAAGRPRSGEIAQTLDRGLRVLEILADAGDGRSPTEVAASLGVHRSIAARLLSTLLNRGYVSRRRDGRYVLGTTLLTLAKQVSHDLVSVAAPLMPDVAERLGVTVVLHVADGAEAVAVVSVEPRNAVFHVGIRPGARHPLWQSASGVAILAGRPPAADDPEEIAVARARGYAITTGRLVPNFTGIAAPVRTDGSTDASVGLIFNADDRQDFAEVAREVTALAGRIARSLG